MAASFVLFCISNVTRFAYGFCWVCRSAPWIVIFNEVPVRSRILKLIILFFFVCLILVFLLIFFFFCFVSFCFFSLLSLYIVHKIWSALATRSSLRWILVKCSLNDFMTQYFWYTYIVLWVCIIYIMHRNEGTQTPTKNTFIELTYSHLSLPPLFLTQFSFPMSVSVCHMRSTYFFLFTIFQLH